MTTGQYSAIREKLGLGAAGMARALGISTRQAERYEAGHPIPTPVAILLRIMERDILAPAQLEMLQ